MVKRVVAPIKVKAGRFSRRLLAPGPLRTLLFGITRPAIGKPKTEEKGN